MTTVISVRGRGRAELLADPSFVYVGRRCAGWKASIWGNPFKPGDDSMKAFRLVCEHTTGRFDVAYSGDGTLSVADCLSWYERLVTACSGMKKRLSELRGKQLGCWCGSWSPGEPEILCHAVILAKLAEAS